jgi:hypothetical protein
MLVGIGIYTYCVYSSKYYNSGLGLERIVVLSIHVSSHNKKRRRMMNTISVTWVNSALEAIRNLGHNPSPLERARIGPPMVARSLANLHTAIYDAWAIYDLQALPTQLRLPSKPAGTDVQRIHAMSQAAYRVLSDQFPSEIAVFDATMTSLGFPLNAATRDARR